MIPFPNLSPDIVSLPLGPVTLTLRWYALAYIVGLLFALWLITRLMRSPALWGDAPPAKPEQIESLLTACILGVILGGRLGFVLFYQPGYYLTHPAEILKVWEGGMSFHGGFLGVVLGGLWFCWRYGVSPLRLGDAMALATPVGLGLGRLANFVNAELWGRPTTLPWGVIFPGEAAQDCPGVVGACARHPSQLYEAGLEGLVLGLVLWAMVRRGALRRPGLVMGAFLIGYGLARAFVELFRQADAQFITPDNPLGRIVAGLSMGQLLSLPMIGVGLWLVLRARRLPAR